MKKITEAKLLQIADEAYYASIQWFGLPPDPQKRYLLGFGKYSVCAYSPLIRSYIIQIAPIQSLPQLHATIAHEMYHRVTMRRLGVHKTLWLNEMLATLSSLWFLQRQHYLWFAEHWRDTSFANSVPISISELKRVRRRSGLFTSLRGNHYPLGFGSAILRVAIAMEAIVGKDGITRIVEQSSLQDWLGSLPNNLCIAVKWLLDIAHDPLPCQPELYQRLGYAYELLGQYQRAKEVYHSAAKSFATNPMIRVRVAGLALHEGQHENGHQRLRDALDLAPSGQTIYREIGRVCQQYGFFGDAIAWLSEAIHKIGELPELLYDLGYTYWRAGDYGMAQQLWSRICQREQDSDYHCAATLAVTYIKSKLESDY